MERPISAVYFDNSRPAPKVQFLNAFEETTFLARLLTAPFGLPCGAVDILGKDLLLEEYTALYYSWEDLFSSLIYAKRGIPDDRIAATIHRYIEVKKDKRVLDTIQEASSAMKTLVEPPKCIELPMLHLFSEATLKNQYNGGDVGVDEKEDSDLNGDTVNTAKTAAALLNQVILALKSALPKCHGIKHEISSASTHSQSPLPSQLVSTFDRCIDSSILTHLGISVPIRMISPRILRTAALAPCSLSSSAVELLKNALKVTIDVHNGQTIQRDFTLQQYYCLLNIFSDSHEVAAVLKEHSVDFLEAATCVEDLQNGALGLSFAVHPTVSYVLQLKSIIAKSDEPNKVTTAICALNRVTGSLRARIEAADAAVIGDMHCAIESITEALEREYSPVEEEEAEEEEVEAEAEEEIKEEIKKLPVSILPIYIKVQLMMDRAEYYLEANMKVEALADCNAVLEMDNRCIHAYALRSKLSPGIIDEEEQDNCKEKEEEEDEEIEGEVLQNESPLTVKKADRLAAAAKDALAAFLVGGSTDLMFASAAEEASREACRISAKRIFAERGKLKEEAERVSRSFNIDVSERDISHREQTVQDTGEVVIEVVPKIEVEDDILPRAWLVQSFFAGYEPLRTVFGMEVAESDEEEFEEEVKKEGVHLKETVSLLYINIIEEEAKQRQDNANLPSETNKFSCSTENRCEVEAIMVEGEEKDGDIDEGTTNRSASISSTHLPCPPVHLLESTSSSSSSSSCRPLDPLGYWTLRCLVCKLENIQYPNEEELAVVQASEERKIAEGYVEELGSWMGEAEKMWQKLCAEEEEEGKELDQGADVAHMIGATDEINLDEKGRTVMSSTCDFEEIIEEREINEKQADEEYWDMMKKLNLSNGEDSDRSIGYSLGLKMGGRGSVQSKLPKSVLSDLSSRKTLIPVLSSSYTPVDVQPSESVLELENKIQEFSDFLIHENYQTRGIASDNVNISETEGLLNQEVTESPSSVLPLHATPCSAFKWCLELLLLPEIALLSGVTFSNKGTVLNIAPSRELSAWEVRSLEIREIEEKEKQNAADKKENIDKEMRDKYDFRRQQSPWENKAAAREEEEEEDGEWEDCDDEEDEEEEEEGIFDGCDNEKEKEQEVVDGKMESEISGNMNDLTSKVSAVTFDSKLEVKVHFPSTSVPVPVEVPHSRDGEHPVPTPTLITPISLSSDVSLSSPPIQVIPSPPSSSSSSHKILVTQFDTVVPTNGAQSLSSFQTDAATPVRDDSVAADDVAIAAAPLKVSPPSSASPLSRSLHARLLSICSSIAYLSGDAIGAVRCLRASVQEDRIADGGLVDSSIKLGSLLIDMDELNEASLILDSVMKEYPKKAIIFLHLAELQIHKSEFHSAVALLKKAQKILEIHDIVPFAPNFQDFREMNTKNLTSEEITLKKNRRKKIMEKRRQLQKSTERQLSANTFALLGVAQFRCAPSSPEISLRTLQEGIVKYPESLYLLLCTGEIISQTGDAVKAIKCFKKASKLNPLHPLPYVNAARTYVQLNQSKKAMAHLSFAISLDEHLASTRVDLSQIYLISGKTDLALKTLELALNMAKHVSEIRDVLTALKIAHIQSKLHEEGIYCPPADPNTLVT